jgi:hypothetical protein
MNRQLTKIASWYQSISIEPRNEEAVLTALEKIKDCVVRVNKILSYFQFDKPRLTERYLENLEEYQFNINSILEYLVVIWSDVKDKAIIRSGLKLSVECLNVPLETIKEKVTAFNSNRRFTPRHLKTLTSIVYEPTTDSWVLP